MNNKKIALIFLVLTFVLAALSTTLPFKIMVISWAVLCLIFFLWLLYLAADLDNPWKKYPAMFVACLGILVSSDPIIQLMNGNLEGGTYTAGAPLFIEIGSFTDLEEIAADAKKAQKPLALWFTKKGSENDIKFRSNVFANTLISSDLEKVVLTSVDIAQISEDEQKLIDVFKVADTPTIIFWDMYGNIKAKRVNAYMEVPEFSQFLTEMQVIGH